MCRDNRIEDTREKKLEGFGRIAYNYKYGNVI